MKNKTAFFIAVGLILLVASGEMGRAFSENSNTPYSLETTPLPILIDHRCSAPELERPAVAFNHDQHTKALKQAKLEDCGVCHLLKETDKQLSNPDVGVFRFPKSRMMKPTKARLCTHIIRPA